MAHAVTVAAHGGGQARRGIGSHWPLVSLAALLILLALAYLWLQITTPSDGSHLQPGTLAITARGLMITPLDPGQAGLEAGDVVVAVDGRAVEQWAHALFPVSAPRPTWEFGDSVSYQVLRGERLLSVYVPLDRYPLGLSVRRTWGTILFALISLPVATFVFLRRPELPATRVLLLSAAALFSATTWSLGLRVSDFLNPAGFWLFQITTICAFMVYWISLLHFAMVFPRPLGMLRRRWLLPATYALPFLVLGCYLLLSWLSADGVLAWIAAWGQFTSYHSAVFVVLALGVIGRQYRLHRFGTERQQLRWVTLAAVLAGGSGLVLYILPPVVGAQPVHPNVIGLLVSVFPVALAIAVLKHNLFDIDTILNRTLVYGGLTAAIVALYVLVVGTLGVAFQTRGDLFVTLVATGIVAVLFQPLRERLQRGANRIIYGERDDPQTVLTRLGKRLEAAAAPESMLPTLVETIAQALKLPYVALETAQDKAFQPVASFGRAKNAAVTFPLIFQGEAVGQLALEPRSRDEPFTRAEVELIETIATQAGVAVYATRLLADLQQSREQLVTAREEERRRLRSDLHDGLGPALAGLSLSLDAAQNMLRSDPMRVEPLLVAIREQIQTLVLDLRRLIHGLRPPALDQLGLVAALREQASLYDQGDLSVDVKVPDALPRLSAAVEVAAYRIVQEALTNVARHAGATKCLVALHCGEQLEVAIEDNGVGLPHPVTYGVGMTSMRERTAELGGTLMVKSTPGGGTRVLAQLPAKRG